eukprot:jgi/Tetstr1/459552/TSEL_004917.t1
MYATFTPLQWASWLHDTADVHRTDWFHRASPELLSRALSHRDTIARLTDADRIALCDYTGRILRLLEDDSAAHCMAAQVNGKRCPYRSGNGLPYCKRHSNHGLPLLAHDDDGATSHGLSYVCFGCGQANDDHPTDSEEADGVYTFNYTTCAASIAAACAAEALGADLPSDAKGYQPLANPAQTYPDRHHLEAYHVNMLTWQWELHVIDSPRFDKSPDGERRMETILSVTGRIRFMHAVHKACDKYGDGGPALSWPSVYAYMQRHNRAFLVSRELCLFDQWFAQLQAKRQELLSKGGSSSPARRPPASVNSSPPRAATSTPADSTPISSPLPALLLRKFGIDHALLVVRTCAAASVHIPAAYADMDGADCRPIYFADGTAYLKLMLAQLAAGLGLTAAPLRAPEAALLAFLDGLHIVRRSFKPSGAREAANRRYLELGRSFSRAPLALWTGRPPRSRKNNYKSCFDNNNAAGVDFDRIIALGFCEGPLHYLPCIVNPIACIFKTVPTYKIRNVVDVKQSGVNDFLARFSCQLSDIHGVLESLQPEDALGKIDLTDAFCCWPTASSDCDYQGFQNSATREYYRYRYSMRQIVEKKMLEARVVAPTQNISHKLADVHDFPAVKSFSENYTRDTARPRWRLRA